MANYDMSDTACIERAETARRLEKLDEAIKIIADVCEDLMARQTHLIDAVKHQQEMININRQSIEEITKCLKQV